MDGEVNTRATGASPGRSLLAWLLAQRRAAAPRMIPPTPRARARAACSSASRLIVVLAVLAMAATLLSAGIGYGLARQSDERLWAEQRASLRNAIAEFRALFGQADEIDPRFVRMVEQSAGLQGPQIRDRSARISEREMQPVMDAHGRIAGFFTWEKTHPMMRAMNRLMPLIAGIALVLVGFAGFSLWQLRRARHELAASEELAARAADEDKLTGLPNHAKTLELLDLSLAERAGDEVTTFALIELDGMADVNAHLGVLGSDELIVAVAAAAEGGAAGAARCAAASAATNSRVTLTGRRRCRCRGGHPRRARGASRARIGSTPWCG